MSNRPNQSLAFGPASTWMRDEARLQRSWPGSRRLPNTSLPRSIQFRASIEGDESLTARLGCEGISSAATYSNAGEITAEPNIAENRVRAVVEDGGRGFELVEKAKLELSPPLDGSWR